MPPSDTELMRRIRLRDTEAFEEFASRHRDAARRHIAGIVHDCASAEDILQEALLRVWLRADQWDGSGAPKAWLFRIAANLALNSRRTVGRRHETPLDGPACDAEGASTRRTSERLVLPGPERVLAEREQGRRLRGLIDSLPEPKRDVARLAWEEEMELRLVAERLDIPEGTVKSRLHHARKWLARQWNADENEGEDRP